MSGLLPVSTACLTALCFSAVLAADPLTTRKDEVGRILNQAAAAGEAAGLSAITYENRDGGHSMLPLAVWPGLSNHTFSKADQAAGHATGPARFLRDHPTIGNCSMAGPAERAGSIPRIYLMEPGGTPFTVRQYLSNQLFIYPEHQDHDPGANGLGGWGDLYPLNSPALLISQGSSGSDQPFLQALLSTIAAFPPDVQRTLIEKRFLAPTLQHLLRRCGKPVASDEDYLSAKAHPVVFDAGFLDELKMVRAAAQMTVGSIPPIALFNIQEETSFEPGVHYVESPAALPWQFATSPVAVGRIFRGNQSRYECLIDARGCFDLLGRPLTVRAVVLQGDPALVTIRSGPAAGFFQLAFQWQPPDATTTPGRPRSHRVDVGIFASNGVATSAPAFFSLFMLPNERRFYDSDGRVAEICYLASNPDLGLPVTDSDLRWLDAIQLAASSSEDLPARLFNQALDPFERDWFASARAKLAKLQSPPGDDSAAPAAKPSADLVATLSDTLGASLPGPGKRSARAALETAFSTIAADPELYLKSQKEIDALAARSPLGDAASALRSEVAKLVDWGVLIRQLDGSVRSAAPPGHRSPAETCYLQTLNLTVLSHALYPRVLRRHPGPAWVDPRLTTPKAWRDVFRYDSASGQCLGWTRHLSGRVASFDAAGKLLPDPPADAPSRPVEYQPDPALGFRFDPAK